jgi:hypothetical protein
MQTPVSAVPVGPSAAFLGLAQVIFGAIGGALVTLVAFRTKIAIMDRRINDRRTEIEKLEEKITDRLDTIDRRQALVLEIVADVARKVGADARFSDAVVRFVAEEAGRSAGVVREREDRDERSDSDDQRAD